MFSILIIEIFEILRKINENIKIKKGIKMKKISKITKTIMIVMIIVLTSSLTVSATTIRKPRRSNPNTPVDRRGITTYYNPSHQEWKKTSGPKLLNTYKAKKDAKYYKPIFYLSSLWLPNNKKDLEITIGTSYSKSVTNVVSSELGVSTTKAKVNLATKVSSSYSSMCQYSSSYSTKCTIEMKNYSTKKRYRPAAYGNIICYSVRRKNIITGKTASEGKCYTFDSKSGCDLRLAVK